jgi:hypothetical protein
MGTGAEDLGQDQPSYPGGVPNYHKFGFIPVGVASGRPLDQADEMIRTVCERLNRPDCYVDEDGYERGITAGAVHPEKNWCAWVEYRCKERANGYVDIEFRLKAEVESRLAIDWIVETYNPYFGCRVGYMAWHGDRVVVIYREKHHTYAFSHSPSGARELVQIADEWAVVGDRIGFRSDEPGFVERLTLPELRRLDRVSSTEARKSGLLPPDYDEANEVNLKIRSMVKKKPRFWPF